jgi:hypothetical protein
MTEFSLPHIYNGAMRELCHRCHRELPIPIAAADRHDDESAILFCPHCAAPQIMLPEHMRIEVPVVAATATGAIPPPPRPAGNVPGQIDWHAALQGNLLVALVGVVLLVVSFRFASLSFLSTLWTLGASVIALGLYARARPDAWMDARTGLRIGFTTGVLLITFMSISLAANGVIRRFGTHSLGGFDAEVAQTFAAIRAQMVLRLQDQNQPADIQQKVLGIMGSPEARAGIAVFYLFISGGFILLLSAGGGAFAGMLRGAQAQRLGRRRSND